MDARAPSDPHATPAPAGDGAPPDPRLSAGQKALLWTGGGCAVLLLVCGGASIVLAAIGLRGIGTTVAAATALESAQNERQDEATALLQSVADRLQLLPELPVELPEQPPLDPWKNGIRWRRSDPHRGVLTSAGPDGDFRTTDDNLEVEVRTDR